MIVSESAHTNTIRVVDIDGEPWFVGSDVLKLLFGKGAGFGHVYDPLEVTTELRKVKRSHLGDRGGRDVYLISESGLDKLIMRSDKPTAKPF